MDGFGEFWTRVAWSQLRDLGSWSYRAWCGSSLGWLGRGGLVVQPHGFSWLIGAKVWLGWRVQVGVMWILKSGFYIPSVERCCDVHFG